MFEGESLDFSLKVVISYSKMKLYTNKYGPFSFLITRSTSLHTVILQD